MLSDFLSIADDTTLKKLGNQDLLGYYQFDDEGVPAQRVAVVDPGVLKNFEMSRSPVVGFPRSSGRGRRTVGAPPVSRPGNLHVEIGRGVDTAQPPARVVEVRKAAAEAYGVRIQATAWCV